MYGLTLSYFTTEKVRDIQRDIMTEIPSTGHSAGQTKKQRK